MYKLVIDAAPLDIQGLVSIELQKGFVRLHLIETAPHNFGRSKHFEGVSGNLFAFACKISFETDGDGFVEFLAKTQLIEHYKTKLGAVQQGGLKLVIETKAALKLVNQYFKSKT